MDAHDGVLALGTDETRFLAIVRAEVVVVDYARGEGDSLADAGLIEVAIEINPFAAVGRPGLAAEGFWEARGDELGFELAEVLAGHGFRQARTFNREGEDSEIATKSTKRARCIPLCLQHTARSCVFELKRCQRHDRYSRKQLSNVTERGGGVLAARPGCVFTF